MSILMLPVIKLLDKLMASKASYSDIRLNFSTFMSVRIAEVLLSTTRIMGNKIL